MSTWAYLSSGKELLSNSKNNTFLALLPRIDENRLIRSSGQLVNADYLDCNLKYPVLFTQKRLDHKVDCVSLSQKGSTWHKDKRYTCNNFEKDFEL